MKKKKCEHKFSRWEKPCKAYACLNWFMVPVKVMSSLTDIPKPINLDTSPPAVIEPKMFACISPLL